MTLKPLSASQISTYRACPRSWGFTYIEGRRPPGTRATDLGGEIHRQMESWLKTSTMPTIPAAQVLVKYVPPPGIALAEGGITFNTPSSPWRGAIDAIYDLEQGRDWLPRAPFTTGHTVVLDFKSTSDLKYAKSAEHLANEDPQSSLYAYYAFDKGAKEVQGVWLYSQTRGLPAVKPVRVKFDRARVEETVSQLDSEAATVQKLYQIRPKVLDLEPKGIENGTCNLYGGCPHASYCLTTQLTGEEQAMSNDFMSFINTKFPANGVSAPAVPAVPSIPAAPAIPSVPAVPTAPAIPSIPSLPVAPPPVPSLPPTLNQTLPPTLNQTQEDEGMDALRSLLASQGKSPEKVAELVGDIQTKTAPLFAEVLEAQERGHANRPRVEHGTINSPEGNEFPFASPEEMEGPKAAPSSGTSKLEGLDRDTLKAHAIKLGVMDNSNRYGVPKIIQLIQGVEGWEQKLNLTAPASDDDLTEALEKSIEAVSVAQAVEHVNTFNSQFSAESELSTGGVEQPQYVEAREVFPENTIRQIIREELQAFFGRLAK